MIDNRRVLCWFKRLGGGGLTLPNVRRSDLSRDTQHLTSFAVVGDTLMMGLDGHRLLSVFQPGAIDDLGMSLRIGTAAGGVCEIDGWGAPTSDIVEFGEGVLEFVSPWRTEMDARKRAVQTDPVPSRTVRRGIWSRQVESSWGGDPLGRRVSIVGNGESNTSFTDSIEIKGIFDTFEIENRLMLDLGEDSWLSIAHPARWIENEKGGVITGARRITLATSHDSLGGFGGRARTVTSVTASKLQFEWDCDY